jgi:hypothetical protein
MPNMEELGIFQADRHARPLAGRGIGLDQLS